MSKITLVAECGVNFEDLDQAKVMIGASKEIQADLCKFQIFKSEHVKSHKEFKKLKKLVLTEDMAKELFEYGKKINQEVFFTPFYPEAVDMCESIGVKRYKIRHNDYNNLELISKCFKTEKPIICSFPHSKYPIIDHPSIDYISCIDKYPTELKDYSENLGQIYRHNGLSCHCKSITPAIIALIQRAKIIEKHVMLEGTDPIEKDWSITFEEFGQLVKIAREMEEIL